MSRAAVRDNSRLFPVNLGTYLANPYFAGLYRHNENTHIYVNSGTNQWG